MRKTVFLISLLLMVSGVFAQVFHEVDFDEASVELNTTVRLSCDSSGDNCPVNSWRLNWNVPDDAVITSIRDSIDRIEDYERRQESLLLTTNRGQRRTSETVEISMRMTGGAEEIHNGLYKREFSPPGFSGKRNSGYIQNSNIISGWTGYGFQPSFSQSNMTFRGTGSSRVRINFGNGNKTEYYEFFGGNPDNTSLAYEISVGMTGLIQDFKRFPVALMKPTKYEDSVVSWSSGEYVGGSFRMRKNLGDKFLPVLAHETVHGLNERELKWDQTSSTWFDEGSAKYVESMVNLKIKGLGRTSNLFGEDVEYRTTINGSQYKVTLPSKGQREELWSYYQGDRQFMKNWNPIDYSENRDFGYAYSELIIKNFVSRQNGSLRELYDKINSSVKVESNERKWDIYSEHLDLKPCKYDERERFRRCLDQINSHRYTVYRADPVHNDENFSPDPLKLPNRTGKSASIAENLTGKTEIELENLERPINHTDLFSGIQNVLDKLMSFLQRLR